MKLLDLRRLVPLLAAPLLAALLPLSCGSPAPAPDAGPPESATVPAGLNDTFLDPELDPDELAQRFEGESREIAVARDAIAATVGLRPDERVADVGAGTGLFLEPFATAVGPTGRVYAVDISPRLVEHMAARAADQGWTQVETVLCTDRSAELGPASVDAVFVCDTYHHFEHPAETLASLYRALVPGGRLVVVEFERIPGVSRDWTLDHVRAGKDTFRAEIERAGFRFVDEVDVEGLSENYVLRFERP